MATPVDPDAAKELGFRRSTRSHPECATQSPRRLCEEFAIREIEDTQLLLCNLAADAFERNEPHVRSKIRWLKTSLLLLAGAVAAVLVAFYTGGMV